MNALDTLRADRDAKQTTYAHTKQRCVTGQATKRQLDAARSAYLLAQSEYRAALIASKKDAQA